MNILVCPGIHAPELTQAFLAQVQPELFSLHPLTHWWVLPSDVPPYAPQQVADFFEACWSDRAPRTAISNPVPNSEYLPKPVFDPSAPLIWIGFSAGVVGAIATARAWQRQGRPTSALIAFDGWGVPLAGDFPIYRFSHDRFTAQTSEWPQASAGYFYAEPGVTHLDLWRSPSRAFGVWRGDPATQAQATQATCAQATLVTLLKRLHARQRPRQTRFAISL